MQLAHIYFSYYLQKILLQKKKNPYGMNKREEIIKQLFLFSTKSVWHI